MSDIKSRVIHTMAEQLGFNESEINAESTVVELNIDSLDALEMVMAVEDEFEIQIYDDETESIATVADLVRIVAAKTGEAA